MFRDFLVAGKIAVLSRFARLNTGEHVTLSALPHRGITAHVIGRSDICTTPTQDLTTGLFKIIERSKHGMTVRHSGTGIHLENVPRRSIKPIMTVSGTEVRISRSGIDFFL